MSDQLMSDTMIRTLPFRPGASRHSWTPQRIRALREFMGFTQRQMADELEVRQQTISEWETGLHTPHRSTQKVLSMVAERVGFGIIAPPERAEALGETRQAC